MAKFRNPNTEQVIGRGWARELLELALTRGDGPVLEGVSGGTVVRVEAVAGYLYVGNDYLVTQDPNAALLMTDYMADRLEAANGA